MKFQLNWVGGLEAENMEEWVMCNTAFNCARIRGVLHSTARILAQCSNLEELSKYCMVHSHNTGRFKVILDSDICICTQLRFVQIQMSSYRITFHQPVLHSSAMQYTLIL